MLSRRRLTASHSQPHLAKGAHRRKQPDNEMEPRHFCRCALLLLLLGFRRAGAQAQDSTNYTIPAQFACDASSPPCNTYVVYRTESSPGYLDLGSISDLFGTSQARIASANGLSSEDGVLLPGQPLLVPVRCGCTAGWSFANVTYPIRQGDTFFNLAKFSYENLTEYHLIDGMNPDSVPTNLQIGQEVTVPLFCRCPAPDDRRRGVRSFITYVWQEGDTMSQVSTLMNATVDEIAEANNVTAGSSSAAPVMGRAMLIPVHGQRPPRLPPLLYAAAAGDGKSRSRRWAVVVGATVAGSLVVVALAALLVAIVAYRRRRCRKTKPPSLRLGSRRLAVNNKLSWSRTNQQYGGHDSTSSFALAHSMTKGGKLLTGVSQFIDRPIIFVEEEIMEATMNLDERCKIGSTYYRAKLDGEVFAVKPARGDVSEELKMMQMVNHANLIKLAGISIGADGDYAFLVYEYAEKGSLDRWLYPKPPPPSALPSSSCTTTTAVTTVATTLSWRQRLSIALDVANGLLYMHEHTQPSMVHGDIRARNVLLTADFRAKISGFAQAKPATADAAAAAPATSSDVFAFGLLLLELLSGRRAMEARVGSEIGMLWREIRGVLEAGDKREAKLGRWMDPALGTEYHMDAALSLAGMARACTDDDAARRPNMTEVVFSLSVLVQPSPVADGFEKLWQPSSEDNIRIASSVSAR